jgi:hypothetical protein
MNSRKTTARLALAVFWVGFGSTVLSAGEPTGSTPPADAPIARKDCEQSVAPSAAPCPNEYVYTLPEEPAWQTVWGLVGLRGIPAGPKIAPDGNEYHPNFSIDLDFNFWVWREQGIYLFSDARFWGERSENGVTNGNDGFWGTSKREFDISGGAAWNYAGFWEFRASGYSLNNLNRGKSQVTPNGFADGALVENRYYLSQEYAGLGQTGYDVARADFVSLGYYPTKEMVGNDGQVFRPGLFLRAYLTYDLWETKCYAFADTTFIAEESFRARLLVFDLGLALRPFSACPQCEFRGGAESTADLQARDEFSLWYLSIRYIF